MGLAMPQIPSLGNLPSLSRSSFGNNKDQWTILNTKGGSAITFTSFLDIDVRKAGLSMSYPIEEGGFANYNKVQSPLEIRVTLGIQGEHSEIEYALEKLNEYQANPIVLDVATPSYFYENMTLEAYSYKRTKENNSTMLTVEMVMVEIREVKTRTTTTIRSPRNPTSASREQAGQKESKSVLYSLKTIISG